MARKKLPNLMLRLKTVVYETGEVEEKQVVQEYVPRDCYVRPYRRQYRCAYKFGDCRNPLWKGNLAR